MNRGDFVERGDRKVDFLKNYRIITRWACRQNGIPIATLELLFYLDAIKLFTTKDFKDGTLAYCWDKNRFYKMLNAGWIEKRHEGNRRRGDHDKYSTSFKAKRLVSKIYKMLIGTEELPPLKKVESYSDRAYRRAINKFNEKQRRS